MSNAETTLKAASPAMAREEDDMAEAILQAAGVCAVLVWTPNGRVLASRGWSVGAAALDTLRAALGAESGPKELAADDAALAEVGGTCPETCTRFCYVRTGADGAGVLFGLGAHDAALETARARGLARLAALAAVSHFDDRRLAGAQLTAIGEIVSGISHDIGTPLNVISGYAESILMSTPGDAPGRKQVSAILEQTRRIAIMVRQMLDIVRPSPEFTNGNQTLERFVGDVFQSSNHMLRRREIRCRLEPGPGGGAVSGDLPRLHQAMFGLLRSAARVVGPRGQLVLRPVSDGELGVGIVLEAVDGAGHPADLSALVSYATPLQHGFDDLLLATSVLADHGGGLDFVRDDGAVDTSRIFVRVGAPDAPA